MAKRDSKDWYWNGFRWLTRSEVLQQFRKAAEGGFLFGNDFRALAVMGDPSWCPYLRELKQRFNWPDSFDGLHFQGAWVVVVCCWFEEGAEGLVRLVRESVHGEYYRGMCLSILSDQRNPGLIGVVASLIPLKFKLATHDHEFETAMSWCQTLLNMFTLSKQPMGDAVALKRIRSFVHLYLKKAVRKVERIEQLSGNRKRTSKTTLDAGMFYFSQVLSLLKHVGDESSITVISSIPPFNRDSREEVLAAIRGRMRPASSPPRKRR